MNKKLIFNYQKPKVQSSIEGITQSINISTDHDCWTEYQYNFKTNSYSLLSNNRYKDPYLEIKPIVEKNSTFTETVGEHKIAIIPNLNNYLDIFDMEKHQKEVKDDDNDVSEVKEENDLEKQCHICLEKHILIEKNICHFCYRKSINK